MRYFGKEILRLSFHTYRYGIARGIKVGCLKVPRRIGDYSAEGRPKSQAVDVGHDGVWTRERREGWVARAGPTSPTRVKMLSPVASPTPEDMVFLAW